MKENKDFIENSFESKISRLKEVVNKMEEGNLSLDETLELFEEGINLYKSCNSIISKAEQRINILVEYGEELKEVSFEGFEGE